jgi:fructuronate reductase
MRLSLETASALPSHILRPSYDRAAPASVIVHLGLGAFHRAHQAVYTEDAIEAGDAPWAIIGVSLRSAAVSAELMPQNGLYTITTRDGAGETTRLIGSVRSALVAPQDPDLVIAAIAAPQTRVVTLTVTEKGYHRTAAGTLDIGAPPVAADLLDAGPPQTLYGFLAAGLARRRLDSLPGLTIVCCDNLANNGAVLAALMREFLTDAVPLARWVEENCAFPSTMVDRIVPAPTAEDRQRLAAKLGMEDAAAIVTEPFSQWVIEDRFAGPRPRWEAGGAQIVDDVRPYELAKLRMLNGAHSALAYLGLQHGHTFVHEAVADPKIRSIVERLMRHEAATSFKPNSGQDLAAYADALFARFANPALGHRLIQIAMDGSQKIPQRWLATLKAHQQRGQACPAILAALAAWIAHVRGDCDPVNDPLAPELAQLWAQAGEASIVAALFGPQGRFASDWIADESDTKALQRALTEHAPPGE